MSADSTRARLTFQPVKRNSVKLERRVKTFTTCSFNFKSLAQLGAHLLRELVALTKYKDSPLRLEDAFPLDFDLVPKRLAVP